jgi:transposase-like protein
LFERYQRSEKALMAALTEMYIQGVSTRKVKAITENLIGHSFFGLIGISRGQEARWRVSGAAWQRCYVHFLRNAIDHLPRKRDDDCLQELRWLYDRRQLKEAKADIKAWIDKWQGRYPKLVAWVEDNIKETLTYYRLPLAHHRNMKSTNMLERFNEEIKRRTRAVRIFPNEASCLRLVRALAVEQHERSQECAATAMTALSLGRVIA